MCLALQKFWKFSALYIYSYICIYILYIQNFCFYLLRRPTPPGTCQNDGQWATCWCVCGRSSAGITALLFVSRARSCAPYCGHSRAAQPWPVRHISYLISWLKISWLKIRPLARCATLTCATHLGSWVSLLFGRLAGLFRRLAGLFRRLAGLFRRLAGLFRRLAGLFRRLAGLFMRLAHAGGAGACNLLGTR